MPIAASVGGGAYPPQLGGPGSGGPANKGGAARDKPRKGGLSMFLSGALEVKAPLPGTFLKPAEAAPKGPAWGGASPAPAVSLREALKQPMGDSNAADGPPALTPSGKG